MSPPTLQGLSFTPTSPVTRDPPGGAGADPPWQPTAMSGATRSRSWQRAPDWTSILPVEAELVGGGAWLPSSGRNCRPEPRKCARVVGTCAGEGPSIPIGDRGLAVNRGEVRSGGKAAKSGRDPGPR